MSFRSRLTFFFVLIVVVTMVAVGVVIFRLIQDSQTGKADARTAAFATEARQRFDQARRRGAVAARSVGRDRVVVRALGTGDRAGLRRRLGSLANRERLARVVVRDPAGRVLASVGDGRAVATSSLAIALTSGFRGRIDVAELDPQSYARTFSARGVALVLKRDDQLIGSTLHGRVPDELPERGEVKVRKTAFRVFSFVEREPSGPPLVVSVLADSRGTGAAIGGMRLVAVGVLVGFLMLALLFAVLVSRALQGQIGRFLDAARRLAGGDFSQPVPTEGRDEFAALGEEFNKMSRELEGRLGELQQERERLQQSIRRIGHTFASNLDRRALLELGTQTAADAVRAVAARGTVRNPVGKFEEAARVGDVEAFDAGLKAAEGRATETHEPAAGPEHGGRHVLAVPLISGEGDRGLRGVIAVGRLGEAFTPDERELLVSLAGQAALSIDNVTLHERVQRQAVTDELTGLSNHRRFQDVIDGELERARRFGHDVGLLMLDIDNFKRVNDTYGHQQGDAVLREVARVLRETSREVDEPARYGGEEMAVALPETDLEGAYNLAERVRTAVEALRVPLPGGAGELQVTASFGVAAGAASPKSDLIEAADRALYEAKRSGKNMTVRGSVQPAGAGRG